MSVLAFFEERNRDFKADKLVYPLETGCLVPALSSYLKRDGASAGDRKVAVFAYKKICDAAIEHFEERYGSNNDFGLQDKTTWKADAKQKSGEYDQPMKAACQELQQGCSTRAAAAVIAKIDLTYNPKRLMIVTRFILCLPILQEVKQDLVTMSDQELKAKYTETYVRNALSLESLITTGGKRPSTVSNMTIDELNTADQLDDGSWIVSVKKHKTAAAGPSQLSFYRDLLYDALKVYAKVFKAGRPGTEPLFSTGSGKAHNMRWSVAWVKPFIPETVASKEEIRTLTAKSFRKGFSNWGSSHPDPAVNRDCIEAQDHSESTDILHYRVKYRDRVNVVNRTIMDLVMNATEPENVDQHVEDNGEQVEHVEVGEQVEHIEVGEQVEHVEVGKRRSRFTKEQKDYMLMALGSRRKDLSLRPPSGVTNASVDKARQKFPHFGDIYDGIRDSTGKTRSKVNNMIFTALRLPKKKAKKKLVDHSETSESEASESEDSDKNVSENDSDDSGSEFEIEIGRKRKKTARIQPVGKKARVVKTPGS